MAGNGSAAWNTGATAHSSAPDSLASEATFSGYHFSCFVATEMTVTVVPRFSLPRVECVGGVYGPFAPNYPVDVPLWLALHLRLTDTCTITPPPYLRIPFLKSVLARERESVSDFEALPFYFYEIAKKLCETGTGASASSSSPHAGGGGGAGGGRAADDIPHVAEVVRLVQEIRAVRQGKLKQSMGVFEPEGSAMFIPGIRLTHIISGELHFLRTSFAVVLQQACAMERRRAQPMAHLTGGGASAAVRLPHVLATPVAHSHMASGSSASPVTGAASTAMSGLGSSTGLHRDGSLGTTMTGVAAGQALDTQAAAGLPDSQVQQSTELPATQREDPAPMAQPPVKKRRTLRQT